MFEKLACLEKIDAAVGMVDRLADLKGREKCASICVLNDLIESIRSDVLVMQEQLKDKEPQPEIKLEVVPNDETTEEA